MMGVVSGLATGDCWMTGVVWGWGVWEGCGGCGEGVACP